MNMPAGFRKAFLYLPHYMDKLFLFIFTWVGMGLWAQEGIKFTVLTGAYDRVDCPVSIDLHGQSLSLMDTSYVLYLLDGHKKTPIPFQVEAGAGPRLHFVLRGSYPSGAVLHLQLEPAADNVQEPPISIRPQNEGWRLMRGEQPLLHYQTAVTSPPAGVDNIFARSGYIHPVWSPSGTVLTRIQPPDHYHHYGLWGPWTETFIQGRPVDFWNLYKGEGTVRFGHMLQTVAGPVFTAFSALQQHLDFGSKGPDQIALNEILEVRAWNADSAGRYWLVDYISTFNCPLDSGILFAAYRYGGGLGFRALESWTNTNSTVLTSEGHTRKTADGTQARWCILEGPVNEGRGGILFMDHPTNRAHPQPMRVWPEDANNGRGDVFFEFCPIRHKSWSILKNQAYVQRYRLLIFDGGISASEAERHWQAFAHPPKVSFN